MSYRLKPPKARWSEDLDEEISSPDTLEVFEGDAVDTGLLDQYGYHIYRVRERIGF